jgi:lipopolysaccharide transport system permease protein
MSISAAPLAIPSPAEMAGNEKFDLVVEPRSGWIGLDVKELLRFHELLFFLTWRDVKVRYKQTILGVAWAVLQPVFNVIMFTVIFGTLANFGSDIPGWLPYSLWVYAALLPWTLVATGISLGGLSLVNSQNLLTKIYFPRLFVPAAIVGGAVVDMVFSILVFAALIAFHPHTLAHLGWQLVFLPVLTLLAIAISLGMSYLLSALTVTYRDLRFVIPFLTQAMMYLSCIMIPASKFHKHPWVTLVLSINPVFGISNAFRWCIFGTDYRPIETLISAGTAILLLLLGMFYFRKTERRFADIA